MQQGDFEGIFEALAGELDTTACSTRIATSGPEAESGVLQVAILPSLDFGLLDPERLPRSGKIL